MKAQTAYAALVPLVLAGATSCGRVGYTPSPTGTGGHRPGTGGRGTSFGSGGRTATNDASLEASNGGTLDGTGGALDGSGGAKASGGAAGTTGNDASNLVDAARATDASLESSDASKDAAPSCEFAPSPISDSCNEIPALLAAPLLDGKLDCGLALIPLAPDGWTGTTPTDGAVPWDATAEYAVGWRPDGVYFFMDVTDPEIIDAEPADPTWKGDGVELYVDSDGVYAAPPAYDDPGTRQLVVAAPVSAGAPPRAEVWFMAALRSAWQTPNLVAVPRNGGYVVEAFVTAADLGLSTWALAPGKHIGFDLALNVSFADRATTTANGGHRRGQYFLHAAAPAYPFGDVTTFCDPTLVGGPDR